MDRSNAIARGAIIVLLMTLVACGGGGGNDSGSSAAQPPTSSAVIVIDSPAASVSVHEQRLVVQGRVQNHRASLKLTLNGRDVALAAGGAFSHVKMMLPGVNTLTFDLKDGSITQDTKTLTVTYEQSSAATAEIGVGGGSILVPGNDPAAGARLEVPANAVAASMPIGLDFALTTARPQAAASSANGDGEADVFALPFGLTQVGAAVAVRPVGLTLNSAALLTLPLKSEWLPAGRSANDVVVYALGDSGWLQLPIASRSASTVMVQLSALEFAVFVPVVESAVPTGVLRMQSTPAGAQVIVDGVDTGRFTPTDITGLAVGQHEVRLFLPAHNEQFVTIQMPAQGGATERATLTRIGPNAPVVRFDGSVASGVVAEKLFSLRGSATMAGIPLQNGRGTLVHNGRVSVFDLDNAGRFEAVVLLDSGANTFACRITSPQGFTGECPAHAVEYQEPAAVRVAASRRALTASAAASAGADIRVTLNWNTSDTDVDLHVFDPSGNRAWYGNLSGIPGGMLDRDDTDGFGPEVFTMLVPRPGRYRVMAHYFSDNGRGASTAAIRIALGGTQLFAGSRTITANEEWVAYEFTVGGALNIVSAVAVGSGRSDVFTTSSGENTIRVSINSDGSVAENAVRVSVRETTEDTEFRAVAATLAGPYTYEFQIAHKRLLSLTDPDPSYPLTFEIKATGMAGVATVESNTVTIMQDVKSQVRQEYIDKSDFNSAFTRPTPLRASLYTASEYTPPANLTFGELALSDYAAYAQIDRSDDIFSTVRTAWARAARVTSGWRNPRRNDRIHGSALNSFHQTGDAIDLNPTLGPGGWPAEVNNLPAAQRYARARELLAEAACDALSADHYVLIHLGHVHIEYEPGEGNAGKAGCPAVQ